MEKVRKTAAAYYFIQGMAVVGWWVLLITRPEFRQWFALEGGSLTTLWAFWLPDLLIIAPVSLTTALLIFRQNRFASSSSWLVTGAVTYATLYTLAIAMMTDHGWLGVVLMLPATLWSGVFATALTVQNAMFRQAKSTSSNYVLLKSFTQIVVVWSLILIGFPVVITVLEGKLGIERLLFPGQRIVALIVFGLVSVLGIWSAVVMSLIGRGTPLPLDHAKELVIQGPYSYVRNPMALSGIGQGLAVAVFLGSPLVAVYALMGSAIWQLVFRPLEEDDLDERFGERFKDYCRNVRCWVPNSSAYERSTKGD